MNKRGFAISIILYSVVFILITIFYVLLGILKTRYTVSNNLRNEIMYELNTSTASYVMQRKIDASSCNSKWIDTLGTSSNNDDVIYLSGTNSCVNFNYVWYSGKLWRVVAIYPDGSMKLVTDASVITFIWGSTVEYNGSWIYQWLTQDFYDTLVNPSSIIKTSSWNYSTLTGGNNARPESYTTQKTVSANVGLLNSYEYYNTSRNASLGTSYLKDGYYSWLLTPTSSTEVRSINDGGGYVSSTPNEYGRGVRPAIVVKPDIKFTGDGTKNNPFRIVADKKIPTNNTTLINSRSIGEYVKFNNELYRILEISSSKTKIIKNDYLIDSGSGIITKKVASSIYYGKSTNDQTDDYWDYYLNNTWYNNLPTTYKNMLDNGTYYIGTDLFSQNYKKTICKDANLDSVTTKNCTKYTSSDVDKTFTGKVGLSRVGEIFHTQPFGRIAATNLWSLTSNGTKIRIVTTYNTADTKSGIDYSYAVRPIVTLKSSIKITGGSGYYNSPFEISS